MYDFYDKSHVVCNVTFGNIKYKGCVDFLFLFQMFFIFIFNIH